MGKDMEIWDCGGPKNWSERIITKRRQLLLQNAAVFGITNRCNFYHKLWQLIYYKTWKTGYSSIFDDFDNIV